MNSDFISEKTLRRVLIELGEKQGFHSVEEFNVGHGGWVDVAWLFKQENQLWNEKEKPSLDIHLCLPAVIFEIEMHTWRNRKHVLGSVENMTTANPLLGILVISTSECKSKGDIEKRLDNVTGYIRESRIRVQVYADIDVLDIAKNFKGVLKDEEESLLKAVYDKYQWEPRPIRLQWNEDKFISIVANQLEGDIANKLMQLHKDLKMLFKAKYATGKTGGVHYMIKDKIAFSIWTTGQVSLNMLNVNEMLDAKGNNLETFLNKLNSLLEEPIKSGKASSYIKPDCYSRFVEVAKELI